MAAWASPSVQYQAQAEPVFVPLVPVVPQPPLPNYVPAAPFSVDHRTEVSVPPFQPPTFNVCGHITAAQQVVQQVVQYQAQAGPVKTPAAATTPFVPVLYPDSIAAPRRDQPTFVPFLSTPGAMPFVPVVYPDYIAALRRDQPSLVPFISPEMSPSVFMAAHISAAQVVQQLLLQYQAVAAPTKIPTAAVPPLAWGPEYPDWIARRLPVPEGLRVGSTSSAFPVPSLSWEPTYPDFIDRKRLSNWQTLAFDAFPRAQVVTLTWQPEYPDLIPRIVRTDYMQWQPEFGVEIGVPVMSWGITFPDMVQAAARTVQSLLVTSLNPLQAVDQFAWRGRYPDWFPVRRTPETAITQPSPSVFPVPSLSWDPTYPDAILFKRTPVEAFRFHFFDPTPITVPTDQLCWRGRYPDWLQVLRPAEYMPWVSGATSSVFPLANPVAWEPTYPDLVAAKAGVNVPPSFTFDAFPRPALITLPWTQPTQMPGRVAMPVLGGLTHTPLVIVPVSAFETTYPDFIPRTVERLQGAFVLPSATTQVLLSSFAPVYPALHLRRVPVNAGHFAWSEWELFRPPSPVLAWLARYPDLAPGRTPLPVGAMQFLAFFKPLFIVGPEVMRHTEQRILLAAFLPESVEWATVVREISAFAKFGEERIESTSSKFGDESVSTDLSQFGDEGVEH